MPIWGGGWNQNPFSDIKATQRDGRSIQRTIDMRADDGAEVMPAPAADLS
jgi:hypothetical protein